MSYPPPPGLKSTPSPHPSLPARPPPATQSSTRTGLAQNHAGKSGFHGRFNGFAPRQVAASQTTSNYNNYMPQTAYSQQGQYDAYLNTHESAFGAAPQIRNPFAPPSAQGGGLARDIEDDPEMAAQIAEWQSAYVSQPASSSGGYTGPVPKRMPNTSDPYSVATGANAGMIGRPEPMSTSAMNSAAHSDTGVASIVSDAKTNQTTVVRSGGGTQWTDSTLLEWDPAHFRIFVGNLAGEVTDDSLYKAFSKWSSIQKARVIRDKRTTKSKGYGFVSFSDGDDYFQAARDMQGKYIGSHPVLIRRSTTEIKAVNPKSQKYGKNNKKGKAGSGTSYDKTGAGVQKLGNKTKGGLKILG